MSWFVKGALVGILGSFPLAVICAVLFRFPVPFGGYLTGPDAILPVLFAVVFYGALGGFAVQAALGGLGGLVGAWYGRPDERRMLRLCVGLSLVASAFGIFVLAVLDQVIGPW